MIYDYTEEMLLRVRDRARAGHSLEECSIELNIRWNDFISDYRQPDSVLYQYYNAGVMLGKQATRDKVFVLARGGSVQAAQLYDKTMREQERADFLKQQREM